MELKQVVVNNGGMSQDLSISKQDDKFAFENKNIRIQATDDGTMLSVTNLRNSTPTETFGIQCDYVLGSCVTPDYLVIFCIYSDTDISHFKTTWDCIYRIDLNSVDFTNSCKVLYKENKKNGTLNFDTSSYFDTLYYEEGETVKKVYWTDGKNNPRVINLITPSERNGGDFVSYGTNVFEFYPDIYKKIGPSPRGGIDRRTAVAIPKIEITKNRTVASELPAGVIQYFMSYYTINGAETLIAASSNLYTIDYTNRGAKSDESGMCAFDIEIPSAEVNNNFDYIRVYSAIRTTEDGPLIVKIVGDIKIVKTETRPSSYKLTDTGINQEQLQDGYIYFIGGTPFIAKTLTEKDGTAFFGNITTDNVLVSDALKNAVDIYCRNNGQYSTSIEFSLTKRIPNGPTAFDSKYPYKLQLDKGSKTYKTFKSGELYRFGIQFQTVQGQWTDVIWIGDAECTERPTYDSADNVFIVNDAEFTLPEVVASTAKSEGYVAYRIMYADPEFSNGRRIKAQGVLCPTMFTPGQRAQNSPYSLPSWVMRPKNAGPKGIAYHHFEPIFSSVVDGAEIASYTPSKVENNNILYTLPYYEEKKTNSTSNCYIVTYVVVSDFNKLIVRCVKIWADEDTVKNNFYDTSTGLGPSPDTYEVLCDYCVPYGGVYNEFGNALQALPKKGSHNNPYGYYAIGNDNKITYIQKESTTASSSTGTDGKSVISWTKALTDEGLPQTWMPSPNILVDIENKIEQSAAPTCYEFFRYVNNLQQGHSDSVYSLGEHLDLRSYHNFDTNRLNEMVKLGFFPLYGRNPVYTETFEPINENITNTHSGSNYGDGTIDKLLKYENSVFSTEKNTYTVEIDGMGLITSSRFITIPEIFRPRCTVEDDGNNPWGAEDVNLYKHSKYNTNEETHEDYTYSRYQGLWHDWNYIEGFIQIIPYNEATKSKKVVETYNDYYVDESIVTLNSPDIEDVSKSDDTINLKVIGVIPFDNCHVNYDSFVNKYATVFGNLNLETISEHNDALYYPFYSDFIYNDAGWDTSGTPSTLSQTIPSIYKTYLFGANNFLGVTSTSEIENLGITFSEFPGIIKKQQILNQYFSTNSIYLETVCDYGEVYYAKTDDLGDSVAFKTNLGVGIYKPFYDNLVVSNNTSHIYKYGGTEANKISFGNSRLKFSTTPHVILNLQDLDPSSKYLLPHFKGDDDYYRTIADSKKYVWEGQVNNVSVDSIPENSRGNWQQSDAQDSDIISIKSIWKEIDKEPIEISEDYFIPLPIHSGTNVSEQVCTVLNEKLNTDRATEVLNNYTKTTTGDVDTYTIINTDSNKFIIGVYEFNTVQPLTPIGSHAVVVLTTYKYYVSEFTIDNQDSEQNTVTIVPMLPQQQPEVGSEVVDNSIIYYDDLDNKLYFKWYNIVKVYDNPSETALDYLPFIELVIVDFPIKYISREINAAVPTDNPYLYIGEVCYDIPVQDLYGGTDDTALRKLSWIPASNVTSLNNNSVNNMEGDTYYQRWDCLKTYPTSEEDVNQIVDITSFMVETHRNLDGRCDINRATYNLMSRPTNFNLFNTVYNQKNNTFEYTVRWSNLASESAPNQIIWSMAKNYLGDVDTWTNVNTSSSTRVGYPVTKLVNYNNSVMAITEHSLEIVNFNAKQLIPSTDNSFIELQNSSKVDGTVKLQAPYGSHNMSTLITEKGLYFIEDNEKSIIRLGGEAGITKIGFTSFTDWLRNNIVQGTYTSKPENRKPFRLEYDSIHKDIYIINEDYCLVYNETIDTFISFVTYSGEYWLYNYNGNLYAYRLGQNNSINVYKMYSGEDYNGDFQEYNSLSNIWSSPAELEYSVWYRINPSPYSDKVFTNGVLMADLGVSSTNTSYPNKTKVSERPFKTLRVWTEYQDTGDVELEHILDKPSLLKQKFRYWRFIIPRDNSGLKRDRIRNPWIHLQLKGDSNKKMEFHNLTIQYMQ